MLTLFAFTVCDVAIVVAVKTNIGRNCHYERLEQQRFTTLILFERRNEALQLNN